MNASIIIPTYNREEILVDTVRMALAQDYPDYEVIVVDQSPEVSPRLTALVAGEGDRIRYIRLPSPNLPAARNAGVLAARGEIIVFVDDDVVFGPDYIASHVLHYTDACIGAVMGLTLPPDGADEEELFAQVCLSHAIQGAATNGQAVISWVVGCNASYRRSAILEAGLSDERFSGSGWYEDADLSVRVRHCGYQLILDSAVKLVHLSLPSGGCRNRDPEYMDQKELDHLRLFSYFNLKNRRILGLSEVSRKLWQTYRAYALNRPVLLGGVRLMLTRQVSYFKTVAQALRWSATPASGATVGSVPRVQSPRGGRDC